jgi:ATP-binding cassette subfamily B protein
VARRRRTTSETEGTATGAARPRLGTLKMLTPYIARHRGRLLLAAGALFVAAAATLTIPLAVRRMIDLGFGADDVSFIDRYFGMLVVIVGVLALASAARFYLVTWLGERVVADLRADVFAHVAHLDAGFFDRTHSGEIVSRLTADATQIKSAVGTTIFSALRNFVLCVGAIAMMVVTSPGLSLLVILAIPVIVLPLYGFARSVRRRSRLAQDLIAEASADATEAIGAMRALQAFRGETDATTRYRRRLEAAFEALRGATVARAALTAVGVFLVFSSVVAVLWMGATDVLAGEMSPGTLGQFVLYAVFAAGTLGELSQVGGELAQTAGAAERLGELLATVPAVADPREPRALPEPPQGRLAFEGVSFAYPTGDGPTLNHIDLAVAPGETVAIVGPSGAGKSTLFALALRFYDPTGGRVLLDGVDLREARLADLRGRIALVPQDTVVFAGTILDNIRRGRPDADAAAVREAAIAARVDRFAAVLPKGLDTIVGERGQTLSGGERQRLAIARALLEDAPILLLDEATSALDAESEAAVQAALEKLKAGRTTIVIAHRLATVLTADRIVVMDGGRIVETGTHRELVARGGLYARLARLQFETGAAALDAAS